MRLIREVIAKIEVHATLHSGNLYDLQNMPTPKTNRILCLAQGFSVFSCRAWGEYKA